MEAPICESCLSSSQLCQECQSRVEERGLSSSAIELFRELRRLSREDRGLQGIRLIDAKEEDGLIAVTVPSGEGGFLIGKKGKVAKKLEQRVKRRLRVVEEPLSHYGIAVSLLKPARVLGINKLFLPQSREKYKVRVHKWDMVRLPGDISSLEKMLTRFMGEEVILYFE